MNPLWKHINSWRGPTPKSRKNKSSLYAISPKPIQHSSAYQILSEFLITDQGTKKELAKTESAVVQTSLTQCGHLHRDQWTSSLEVESTFHFVKGKMLLPVHWILLVWQDEVAFKAETVEKTLREHIRVSRSTAAWQRASCATLQVKQFPFI